MKALKFLFITLIIFCSISLTAQGTTYKVAEVTVSQFKAYIIYDDGTKDELPKVTSEAQIIAKFLNDGWELKSIFYLTTAPTMIFIKPTNK